MAFIDLVEDDDFAAPDRRALGYTPNYNRLFARRPAAYAAWKQLNGAVKETMDLRRYELVTLAAAGRLRSTYCSLAHGKVLLEQFVDAAQLKAIAAGRADAVGDVDAAVMELAAKVVDDATSVTQDDVGRLRELGLSDDEILDVVLAAASRCFFSKVLDALGVEADSAYRELDGEVREALTIGRPIES